jgi:sterol desaturase/sphingolipid hydroxylase (fatty acid hydroxylase superfamily)
LPATRGKMGELAVELLGRWLTAIAWAMPACLVLEALVPRTRAPIRWRAIALACCMLGLNLVVVRAVISAPPSTETARIVAAWILAELAAYGLHRAMHRVPLLWRIHRMHHSAGVLAWHQSWWIHPLDAALFACATTVACHVAGAPLLAAAPIIIGRRVLGILQHANIAWPPSLLDHVVVTPAVHHRHHREDLPPANFAGVLAIVDRVFGTWAPPDPGRTRYRYRKRSVSASGLPARVPVSSTTES